VHVSLPVPIFGEWILQEPENCREVGWVGHGSVSSCES
jgi:hypothetical protein